MRRPFGYTPLRQAPPLRFSATGFKHKDASCWNWRAVLYSMLFIFLVLVSVAIIVPLATIQDSDKVYTIRSIPIVPPPVTNPTINITACFNCVHNDSIESCKTYAACHGKLHLTLPFITDCAQRAFNRITSFLFS